MTSAEPAVKHPATYTPAVLDAAVEFLPPGDLVLLDPFAGNGLALGEWVEKLNAGDRNGETIRWRGVELEPEWACQHPNVEVGDATVLDGIEDSSIDVVLTSVVYGTRMGDRDMRDSVAATYMKSLGREASEGSACHLQFRHGDSAAYRVLHVRAYRRIREKLRPGGRLILNVSDHERDERRVRVVAWHISALLELGFDLVGARTVKTPRMRRGANADARVPHEMVIAFDRDEETAGRLL